MNEEYFKFQTVPEIGFQGADIDWLLSNGNDTNAQQTTRLRNMLASVSDTDFQSEIWQEDAPQCSGNSSTDYNVTPECYDGGPTFKNISGLLHPYLAQLPSGYNTGLLRQYVPRINSSVEYSNVSVNEFPPNCTDIPGAYYIEYAAFDQNMTSVQVQVCMPNDQSKSPWRMTQDRQDISESLFLNFTFGTLYNPYSELNPPNATFKLSANTTLGYFELPNYRIGPNGGPLLTNYNQSLGTSKRSLQFNEGDGDLEFFDVSNKGPLAMLTAALFEPGSYIATQIPKNTTASGGPLNPECKPASLPCTIAPLDLLLNSGGKIYSCYTKDGYTNDDYLFYHWIGGFYEMNDIGKDMRKALHAAVILASQVWLTTGNGMTIVEYDMGQDFVRPKISATGVIVISILLAADLFLLLALALYIRLSYTWTSSFDPLTMMRLGARRADILPLMINSPAEEKKIRSVLENMPGWIGDGRPDDEDAGVLALGALAPLRPERPYLLGVAGGK